LNWRWHKACSKIFLAQVGEDFSAADKEQLPCPLSFFGELLDLVRRMQKSGTAPTQKGDTKVRRERFKKKWALAVPGFFNSGFGCVIWKASNLLVAFLFATLQAGL